MRHLPGHFILATVLLMAGAMPALAASEAEFKSAYAAAEAAEKQADQLRNKWTTTEAQLAAAKKAAATGDFEAAVAAAKDAGLLNAAHIAGGMDAWKKAGGPVLAA